MLLYQSRRTSTNDDVQLDNPLGRTTRLSDPPTFLLWRLNRETGGNDDSVDFRSGGTVFHPLRYIRGRDAARRSPPAEAEPSAIGKSARERMEMMAIPRRSNRYRNVWNERTEDCLNKEGTEDTERIKAVLHFRRT